MVQGGPGLGGKSLQFDDRDVARIRVGPDGRIEQRSHAVRADNGHTDDAVDSFDVDSFPVVRCDQVRPVVVGEPNRFTTAQHQSAQSRSRPDPQIAERVGANPAVHGHREQAIGITDRRRGDVHPSNDAGTRNKCVDNGIGVLMQPDGGRGARHRAQAGGVGRRPNRKYATGPTKLTKATATHAHRGPFSWSGRRRRMSACAAARSPICRAAPTAIRARVRGRSSLHRRWFCAIDLTVTGDRARHTGRWSLSKGPSDTAGPRSESPD